MPMPVVELILSIRHPFCHRKILETEILGKLESQITKVEDCAKPSKHLNNGFHKSVKMLAHQLYLNKE